MTNPLKLVGLTLVALLAGSLSMASPARAFILFDSIPTDPNLQFLVPAAESVFKLSTYTEETSFLMIFGQVIGGTVAGAFFVSHDGYALTNAHAILGCLLSEGYVTGDRRYLLYKKNGSPPYPATCRIQVNGLPRQAEVLAFGMCSSKDWPLAKECEFLENDFALLRIKDLGPTPCLRIAPAPAVGTPIQAIGYPMKTEGRIVNSDGTSRYRSEGITKLPPSPKHLTTDADTVPGNSGGVVVDRNGDAVGLSRSGWNSAEFAPAPGKSLSSAIALTWVQQAISDQIGPDKTAEAFDCNRGKLR